MKLLANTLQSTKRALLFIGAALLALVLSTMVLCQVAPEQAYAKNSEYKYTVRVYAGDQGSFNGKDSIVLTKSAKPGDRVTFNQGSIKLKDGSKYYIKGVKLSGRDNDTSTSNPSFKVKGDTDLVVSYGVLGDNVPYTVKYVDANGNDLSPSETFYGNVGDSPVIAYRYIEGYTPRAYNLTGKLDSDPSKNVYTFTYDANNAGGGNAAENPGEAPQAAVIPVPGAGEEGAGGEGDAGAAGVDAGDAAGAVVPEEAIPDDANPLANPDEVQDIRDEENPLAFLNGLIGDDASFLMDQAALWFASGLIAAALLAFLIVFIVRRRNKKKELAYETARSEVIASEGTTPDGTAGSHSAAHEAEDDGHSV